MYNIGLKQRHLIFFYVALYAISSRFHFVNKPLHFVLVFQLFNIFLKFRARRESENHEIIPNVFVVTLVIIYFFVLVQASRSCMWHSHAGGLAHHHCIYSTQESMMRQ